MSVRSDQTKQKIFDTMVELMGQRGYQGVSVDEVAARAGVAKGTLYYHYKGKAEMMEALLHDRLDPVIKDLSEIAESAHEDAFSALKHLIEAEFDFLYTQRSFSRVLLTELWREDRGWQEGVRELRNAIVGIYTRVLNEGIAQGCFRDDMPIEYGASAIFGLTATSVLDRLMFDLNTSVEEVRDNLLFVILNVVKKLRTSKRGPLGPLFSCDN